MAHENGMPREEEVRGGVEGEKAKQTKRENAIFQLHSPLSPTRLPPRAVEAATRTWHVRAIFTVCFAKRLPLNKRLRQRTCHDTPAQTDK